MGCTESKPATFFDGKIIEIIPKHNLKLRASVALNETTDEVGIQISLKPNRENDPSQQFIPSHRNLKKILSSAKKKMNSSSAHNNKKSLRNVSSTNSLSSVLESDTKTEISEKVSFSSVLSPHRSLDSRGGTGMGLILFDSAVENPNQSYTLIEHIEEKPVHLTKNNNELPPTTSSSSSASTSASSSLLTSPSKDSKQKDATKEHLPSISTSSSSHHHPHQESSSSSFELHNDNNLFFRSFSIVVFCPQTKKYLLWKSDGDSNSVALHPSAEDPFSKGRKFEDNEKFFIRIIHQNAFAASNSSSSMSTTPRGGIHHNGTTSSSSTNEPASTTPIPKTGQHRHSKTLSTSTNSNNNINVNSSAELSLDGEASNIAPNNVATTVIGLPHQLSQRFTDVSDEEDYQEDGRKAETAEGSRTSKTSSTRSSNNNTADTRYYSPNPMDQVVETNGSFSYY